VRCVITCKALAPSVPRSARASRAGDRALSIANFGSIGPVYRIFGGAPKSAREARSLPGLRRFGDSQMLSR
jgi:hypothetical protein